MNTLVHILAKSGLLTKDLDYHLIRASMVLIFLAFGYQKWFAYEAQVLIPYISNGPLIFWLYPVFGIRGASWPKRSTKTSIKLLVVIPRLGPSLRSRSWLGRLRSVGGCCGKPEPHPRRGRRAPARRNSSARDMVWKRVELRRHASSGEGQSGVERRNFYAIQF